MSYDPRENIEEYYPSIRPQTPAPEVDPSVLEKHLLARNNPHVVTAEQTGAYDKSTVDNKIATATKLNKKALDEAVGQASGFANEAKSAAGNAKNYEASASEAANVAVSVEQSVSKTAANVESYVLQAKADIATQGNTIVSNAKTSETNAKTSESNAKTSESNAKTSEGNAKTSESNAATNAANASNSAEQASKSAQQAEQAKDAIGDVGGRLEAVETSVGILTETVEANNNVAKHTVFPNFVKMICDALTATKLYGTIKPPTASYPLRFIYTMANGWTALQLLVPNNTDYICVFDAEWNLLYSRKRNLDVRSGGYFACIEVGGIAYAFGSTQYLTIAEGENGEAIVEADIAINFNDLATSIPNIAYNINALGRNIIVGNVVFDTEQKLVTQTLLSRCLDSWVGDLNGEIYANIAGYIYKITLDENGAIALTQVTTSQQRMLYVNKAGITKFRGNSGYVFIKENEIINSTSLSILDENYGKTALPSVWRHTQSSAIGKYQDSQNLYKVYLPKHDIIVGACVNGNIVALTPLNLTNNYFEWMVRERILCPINGYSFRPITSQNVVGALIHGLDSKGIWMSFAQTNNWVVLHTVAGKVFRVLWEDLK